LNYHKRVNSRRDIVEHDAGAAWKPLQTGRRENFRDVEETEQNKAR
jgi:hypothetical protein